MERTAMGIEADDREAGAQAHVDRDRAEDDPEEHPEEDRPEA